MAVMTTSAGEPTELAEHIGALRREIRAQSTWRSPVIAERRSLQRAFRALFQAAHHCHEGSLQAVQNDLDAAGFMLTFVGPAGTGIFATAGPPKDGEGPDVLIVQERPEQRRGGGLYVVRCGEAEPLVVQAPHSFYDLDTGEIADRLFAEHPVRAAFWNTVHRYRGQPGETTASEVHVADVAHQPASFFQAATVAAAAGDPSLRFVQLHGFADADADAILSSGDPDRHPTALGTALARPLGEVTIHGDETHELGGTTNVQQLALNSSRPGHFAHLELARDVRRRLAREPVQRALLFEALRGPWW